jgi:Tol biopolymer transport system component
MKKLNLIGLVALFVFAVSLFAQSTDQIFQQALLKENAEGNLTAAVEIYQKIAEDSRADRSLRAKAQLHIGICWEKLGRQEARSAYLTLIRDFADQQDMVTQARTRLSALEKPTIETESRGMTVRKIWEGLDVDDCGQISPDGKYLSYVDWNTGDLAVYEMATGKKRHLTNKGSWENSDEFAESAIWSPDSKRIVYAWYNEDDKYELRMINLDGGEPRIFFSTDEYSWLQPCDWSHDGKQILTRLWKRDTNEVVVFIATEDSTMQIVREFEKDRRFHNVMLSPEENCVVYDAPGKVKFGNHDIFLYSMQRRSESVLVEHPAYDQVLGWSPNGKYLLFTSDRTGTPDIWVVKVEDGKSVDNPVMIKSEKGPIPLQSLGCTSDGLFYYSYFPNQADVYVTEIDPENGKIVAPPREAINHFIGSNSTPDYSPDGKYLAYISRRPPFNMKTFRPIGNVLCIRSLDTGEDIEIRPPGLNSFGFPRWSPDSRSVMVVNWEDDRQSMGHYLIDVKTGKTKLVVLTHYPQYIYNHAWQMDGQSVFLVRSDMINDSTSIFQIVERDILEGTEKILLSGDRNDIYFIAASPDGRWLAVLGHGPERDRDLRILPTSGGETKVVRSFEIRSSDDTFITWSADSKSILLPKVRQYEPNLKWDIWRIPIDGREPQSLGLDVTTLWWLSAHPDGRHIAFSNQGSYYELPSVWVMENFLPE